MNSKKGLLLAFTLLIIGSCITAGVYAFWSWTSNANKNIIFNTSQELRNYVVYDEGESKFVGDFQVSNSYTDGIHSTISLYKTAAAANVDLIATIYMDINSICTNMKQSSALKWKVTIGNSTNIGSTLAEGNLVGTNDGDTITLVPNIEVTTTLTEYTIWIWIDANANPSSGITGETLDTNVWTEINQVEGTDQVYQITRIGANYQNINATVVNNKNKIVKYAVTTTNTEPAANSADWVSIPVANQSNTYNLNTNVGSSGTYYVWFKDEDGVVVHAEVEVETVDTTGPSCTWGSFSPAQISNGQTSNIELTCTDNESEITVNNLTTSDITKSNNYITITNITKTSITNGYRYVVTVTGGSTDGTTTLSIAANKVKNAMAYGNSAATSTSVTVASLYTIHFASSNNNCTLNATTYADKTPGYGTTVNITNPSCTGYTFAGWTADAGLDTTNAKYGTSSGNVNTTWSNASTPVTATYFKDLALRNNATVTLTATWTANALTFNNQTLNTGTFGGAYTSNAFSTATNGSGNYTYTIVSGAPTGATLNSSNRTLSFTSSTAAGTYHVVVKAADNVTSSEAQATMTIVINKYTPTITLGTASSNVNEGAAGSFTATVNTIASCVGTLTATSANTNKVTIASGSASTAITSSNMGTAITINYNGVAYTTGVNISANFTPSDNTSCNSASTVSHSVAVNDITPPTGVLSASLSNGVISSSVTVSDTGIGPSGNYWWKVSKNSTCNSTTTGFVSSNLNTYTFNITSKRVYYVCVKFSDGAGNYGYESEEIDATEFDVTLTNGLIPVTIANDGTVTAVEKNADEWYDYDNKKWANAVLVTSTNRSTYQNIADGIDDPTTIPASEILAYFVYIPRYKYKIWQAQGAMSSQGQEQSIDIVFEHQNDNWANGSTVNSYMTHPAFWFDLDGDGTIDSNEKLGGYWAGKFSTSISNTSSSCYTSPSTTNCDNANFEPRILPNRKNMTLMSISNAFKNSIKMSGGSISGSSTTNSGNSTYGLSSNVYAHIFKNREWGAVLYLSHSTYGKNGEITVNNHELTTPYTGCGTTNVDYSGTTSSSCLNAFGTVTSYPQSTTGNISGVFDMVSVNGGNFTMALFQTYVCSSGFSSSWISAAGNLKYIDVYTALSYQSSPVSESWGHAMNETYEWYGGTYSTQSIFTAWQIRSGYISGYLTPQPYTYAGYNGAASDSVFGSNNTKGATSHIALSIT